MSFTISFSFRGQIYIASVYRSNESGLLYSIYFTDVDLILEFGPKVDYAGDGQLQVAKEIDDYSRMLLHQALNQHLSKAA